MPDIPEIHRGKPDIGAVLWDKPILIVALRRMEDGIVDDHIAWTAEQAHLDVAHAARQEVDVLRDKENGSLIVDVVLFALVCEGKQ